MSGREILPPKIITPTRHVQTVDESMVPHSPPRCRTTPNDPSASPAVKPSHWYTVPKHSRIMRGPHLADTLPLPPVSFPIDQFPPPDRPIAASSQVSRPSRRLLLRPSSTV